MTNAALEISEDYSSEDYSSEENAPDIWIDAFHIMADTISKYDRGHVVVFEADEFIGATRLSASACSRIGAGLVTVLAGQSNPALQLSLPADIMVKQSRLDDLSNVTTLLGGPGGISKHHLELLLDCKPSIMRVLDAGALSEKLRHKNLGLNTVITPHDGEFESVFGNLLGDRVSQTQNAAKKINCIIVRKGAKTIIAHPNGRSVINDNPNPFLAKAGTGDVLAGFIAGLIAQSIPVFEACCAAVWIHSNAGDRLGPGLTACDLEYTLPDILREIYHD